MKRFTVLLLSLVIALNAVAQNSARYQAMAFIKEGDNFLRMGNWNDALISFSNAISADPSYADAYMKRAMLNKRLGANEQSDIDYGRAIDLNPYSVYIYDQRNKLDLLAIEYLGLDNEETDFENVQPVRLDHEADEYIHRGAYREALTILDTLIAMGFEREFEYEKKALVHLLLEDYVACESYADSALMLSRHSALAHDLKGLSQLMKGQYTEAISSLTTAIGIDPSFSVAYLNRAVAYLRSGEMDLALQDLQRSIEISQDVAMKYYLQGMLLRQQGRMKESIGSYDAAVGLDSSYTKALFNRSFTWKMMGNFTKAMEDAAAIVQFVPESPEYWNLKGNMHTLYTEYYAAIECYDRAISLNPSYAEAYFNRGLAHFMSYAPVQGCNDLQESGRLGYARADDAIFHFCGR
jgi:tetratricopeptide (TPR) repeat protein